MDIKESLPLTGIKPSVQPPVLSNGKEEPSQRQRQPWTHTLDFLISLIGSAVGLGNVWRFPFLCYRNGGGTFLIPYCVCLFLLAIPQQLFEVSLAQIMSRGSIGVWDICPIVRGCGYFQVVIEIIFAALYMTVIGWGLYYTCCSFMSPLPWSSCNNAWNSPDCTTNFSANATVGGVTSTTEFWEYKVLGLTSGIDEVGGFQWQLYLCCIALWTVLFLSLCRGVSLSGKVMYPITIIPYVLLFMLLGYTATIKGSGLGLYYFLTPDWSKLLKPQVWADGGRQIFYSLSVGFPVTMGLASHNRYRKRSYIDCLVTAAVNSLTSFLAGIVVFMTLGYMSVDSGVPIDKVADSGVGLAFVTYPLVLMKMPFAQVWSVVFFLMLTFMGFSSIMMAFESVFSAASDLFPKLDVKGSRQRYCVTLLVCAVGCVCSSISVFGNSMYVIQLIEFYNGNRSLFLSSILMSLSVMYVFGGRRFVRAVHRMYRISTGKLLLVLWGGVTPAILVFIMVSGIVAYTSLSFRRGSTGEVYEYPAWSVGLGWCMEVAEFALIPGYAVYLLTRQDGPLLGRLRKAVRPRLTEVQRRRLFGDRTENGTLSQ